MAKPSMYRFALAALMVVPTAFSATVAHAQYYNPYQSQYRQWNQSFPGYQGGGSEYRQQIREMNPYGNSYRQYQQDVRRSNKWSNW